MESLENLKYRFNLLVERDRLRRSDLQLNLFRDTAP